MAKELSEEESEESSDNLSDSQSRENSSGVITQEGRRGRWMRRGTAPCMQQAHYWQFNTATIKSLSYGRCMDLIQEF